MRRRHLIGAVTLAFTVIAGAPSAAGAAQGELLSWQLLEARTSSTFWVSPIERPPSCVRVEAHVLKSTRQRVRVQLVATRRSPVKPCDSTSDLRAPKRYVVHVRGGLRGQTVGGPRFRSPLIPLGDWKEWHREPPTDTIVFPRLVGLSARQAAGIVRRLGFDAAVGYEGPKDGRVVEQRPRAGETVGMDAAAVLTTR